MNARDREALDGPTVRAQINRSWELADALEGLGADGVTPPMVLDALGTVGFILTPDPGIAVDGGLVTHGLLGMLKLGGAS